jgi:glycosyl transferase family 25
MSIPDHDSLQTHSSFDTLFDCFVINLRRQPERLQSFLRHNKPSGIEFKYFEAVDGVKIEAINIWGPIIAKGAVNYTSGMIGCAMSHLALWRRCAEQKKHFIVLEDDAVVRADIKMQTSSLVLRVPDWDMILLGYNTDVPLELNISPGINFGGLLSVRYPTAKHLSEFVNSTILSVCTHWLWPWDFVATP